MKKVYCYSPENGAFLFEDVAFEDPLNPIEFILPADCTEKEPPSYSEGEIPIWNGKRWGVKKDYRGKTVYSADGSTMTVTEPGNLPKGYTLEPQKPKVTLEEAKASKLKEINDSCDKAVDALLEDYPDAEKASFEQQYREAVKYQETGNPANAPLLSLLADARGISLDALCIKVIAKRNAYTLLCGNALAQKQQLKEKLERLKTVSAVESLDTTITIGDMK